jgi:hypothetical protein
MPININSNDNRIKIVILVLIFILGLFSGLALNHEKYMSKAYVYAAEQIDLHCPYAFIANNYTTQEQRENDMFNKTI